VAPAAERGAPDLERPAIVGRSSLSRVMCVGEPAIEGHALARRTVTADNGDVLTVVKRVGSYQQTGSRSGPPVCLSWVGRR
jgi:hypothetical protein